MVRLFRLFACLALTTLLAPQAMAQVRAVPDAPDPWVHAATGTSFPSHIGDFQRREVDEYNADGTDASIGYDLVRNGKRLGYLTVYIYPPFADGDCDRQFEGVKRDVRDSNEGVEQLGADQAVPSPTGRHAGGHFAPFRMKALFDGTAQPVLSDAYLFCAAGGKWLVMYRATWPADGDMRGDIATLMHAIRWPDLLDR